MPHPPHKIKTVFFDMGSTLVGLQPSWEAIYHQVFQKAGYDLPIGTVEQAVSYSWNIVGEQDALAEYETTLEGNRAWQLEVEKRVMQYLNIPEPQHEDIFWNIIAAFEHEETYQLYPEAIGVLTELKRAGYGLGIISNWGWHLPELCQKLDIAQYFEYICASARVGYPKPRPEIFREALRQLEAEPASSLHIGDSWTADVLGARGVGITGLWVDRPNNQLYPPDLDLTAEERKSVRIISLREVWNFL